MIRRTKKLVVAGIVLAVGVGLALPFRRDDAPNREASVAAGAPQNVAAPSEVSAPQATAPSPLPQRLAGPVELPAAEARSVHAAASTPQESRRAGIAVDRTAQRNAITRQGKPPAPPALAAEFPTQPSGVAATNLRPVYAQAAAPEPSKADDQRIHVIHNGDTLERLARRYLGDASRALELFDHNRDVLDNPHLLPIGAELEIPE